MKLYLSKCSFVLLGILLSSCASIPSIGPSSESLEETLSSDASYKYINISEQNISELIGAPRSPGVAAIPGLFLRRSTNEKISPGDVVDISIWEPDALGVFGRESAKGVGELSNLRVGLDGGVQIPYAGKIIIAGKTPTQAALVVANELKTKVNQPQVIINQRQTSTKFVSVFGDVGSAGLIEVPTVGLTLSDAMAKSGGVRGSIYDYLITLRRGAVDFTGRLSDISVKSHQIFLAGGDSIQVTRDQRAFLALGAFRRPGEFLFDSKEVSLLNAISKAEGISNQTGDASYIFLIRRGLSIENVQGHGGYMIYRFNFKLPDHVVWAGMVKLESGDAIYAPEAQSVPLTRVLGILSGGVGIGAGASSVVR